MNEGKQEVISGSVQVGGYQYHWERRGVTDRPILVFLNGMAASTSSWNKYLPYVQDDVDVVLYDYLGQGQSDAPDVPYGLEPFADALDAVLDANNVDRAWIMGASYGAFVGLEVLRVHPERIRGLFLSGVLLERARLFEMYLDLSLRWYRELPFDVYPEYLYEKMFSEKYVRAHEEAVEAAKHHMLGFKDKVYRLIRLMDAQRDWLLAVDDRRSDYLGRDFPVFVLAGAQDRLIPPWFQETAASALGATYETVPECAHSVYLEQTDLFFDRLRNFISG